MSRDPLTWFSINKTYQPGGFKRQKSPFKRPPIIKNKIARNILITLAAGAGGALVTMSPVGAVYFMIHGAVVLALEGKDYKHEIKRLKKKGYIALTKSPKGFVARLLKKSRKRLKRILLEDLKLPQGLKWDGKWRLYIFDIPEKYRSARDTLRAKLKSMGMYNIQRSVFAYPFDCREELEFLGEYYEVSDYSTYVETSYSDIDKELRKYFKALLKNKI